MSMKKCSHPLPDEVRHELDCIVDSLPRYGVCGCVPGFDSTVRDNGSQALLETVPVPDHIPSDAFFLKEAEQMAGPGLGEEPMPDDTVEMLAIS